MNKSFPTTIGFCAKLARRSSPSGPILQQRVLQVGAGRRCQEILAEIVSAIGGIAVGTCCGIRALMVAFDFYLEDDFEEKP